MTSGRKFSSFAIIRLTVPSRLKGIETATFSNPVCCRSLDMSDCAFPFEGN